MWCVSVLCTSVWYKSVIDTGVRSHRGSSLLWCHMSPLWCHMSPLLEPMEMLCFSLMVLTRVAAGELRTFRESLILPSVGSRPKYLTCYGYREEVEVKRSSAGTHPSHSMQSWTLTCICCPTSNPRALGCLIWRRQLKNKKDESHVTSETLKNWLVQFNGDLTRLWSSCELWSRTALMLG